MYAPKLNQTANKKSFVAQKKDTSSSSNLLLQQISRMDNAPNPREHADMLNRAPANQQAANQQLLLQLQRQYGNGYVSQVVQLAQQNDKDKPVTSIEKPVIQAKLAIGQVGDKYEQEADHTAHKVVQRMSEPGVKQEAVAEEDQRTEVQQETDSIQIQKCGCNQKNNLVQMKPEAGALQSEEISENLDDRDLMVQRQPETEALQPEEISEDLDDRDLMVQRQPETDVLQPEEISENLDDRDLMVQRQPETEALQSEEVSEDLDDRDLMVQRKPSGGGMAAPSDLDASIQRQLGKGQPLSGQIQKQMEQAFGRDFSGVRIHVDTESDRLTRSIQARAFTVGRDIFFRQGEYMPGSKQGQELLAHELTHVIQQNGSGVKSQGDSEVKVSESSQDIQLQRACSQCEQGKKEEQAEGIIQAKEESGGNPEAGDNQIAESDDVDCNQENDKDEEKTQDNENGKEEKCPSEKGDESSEESEAEDIPSGKPELEKSAKCDRQKPKLNISTPPPLNLSVNPTNTSYTKTSTSQQNFSDTGEAANSEITAEKVQGIITARKAQEQLRNTDAKVARLASTTINFKLPQQEGTDTDNNAALEQQRATASSMASNFFTKAALRVQTVTGLGQSISDRINGVAENAKAAVLSTVQQQKDTVAAQINQQRTQVENQAQISIAKIEKQHQATLTNIFQETKVVSLKIQTEYRNAFQKANEEENILLAGIDQLYLETYDQYIAAGEEVGEEAIAVGEKWEEYWESQKKDEDESDYIETTDPYTGITTREYIGDVHENDKLDRKAEVAIEVAEQYKEQVIEAATQYADQLAASKAKDIKGICCSITQLYKHLQKQQEETLKALTDFQQQAVAPVMEAQTQLTESVNQTLQTTLESLDEQETAQLQILQGYGDRQILAMERDAQKAIASLQKGVNQAATKLLNALQDYYTEFQGMEAPHPDELSVTLAEILGQFDSSIARVLGATEKGIAASERGIKQGEQQVVGAVNAIAQTGIEESETVVEQARTSFANLDRSITDTFTKLRDAYTKAANKFVKDTATGLAEINSGKTFKNIYNKLSGALGSSVPQLKEGLREILGCLETDIQNYAAKAVEDQPLWKLLLKALVIIAAIVIGILVGPLAIGFVATALKGVALATAVAGIVVGAALGAGLGVLGQMANNVIDGKNLMDDIGDAALAGAIGGAIGGFGGALGGALGHAGKLGAGLTKSFWKYGIETAFFDTLGTIFGDLAAGNFSWEGVLMGLAIGTAVHVSTTKLHGINKRAELANFAEKHPGELAKLPEIQDEQIKALAKETGMDAGELSKLAKLKPDELNKRVEDAKQRTSKHSSLTIKVARVFERTQRGGYDLGERAGSALVRPIKNVFGGSPVDVPMTAREQELAELVKQVGLPQVQSVEAFLRLAESNRSTEEIVTLAELVNQVGLPQVQSVEAFLRLAESNRSTEEIVTLTELANQGKLLQVQSDVSTLSTRPDVDTETPRGLKPDTKMPMTTKEQEVLENTAPKRLSEMTREEVDTEFELAGKAKPKLIDDGEFVEQRELPNDHEWKEKEDGTWCRFSEVGECASGMNQNPGVDRAANPRPNKRRKVSISDLTQDIKNINISNQLDLSDLKWLKNWYSKPISDKSMNAKRKFTQLFNNIFADKGVSGENTFLKRINSVKDWSDIEGPLLSTLLLFHMHIAPYQVAKNQGYDRNMKGTKEGTYFRSHEHRLKDMYEKVAKATLKNIQNQQKIMPPLNLKLLEELKSTASNSADILKLSQTQDLQVDLFERTGAPTNFPSLAITQNNLTLLRRVLKLLKDSSLDMSLVFDYKEGVDKQYNKEKKGRSLKDTSSEPALDLILSELKKMVNPSIDENYHDFLLRDRGQVADELGQIINTDPNPNSQYKAVGAEGHPSLIIQDIQNPHKGEDWENDFLQGLNKLMQEWPILSTKRGSFGFPRPTVSPVAESLRLWLGFAPKETLEANLRQALNIPESQRSQSANKKSITSPKHIHVEALKTAVRHTIIVHQNKGNIQQSKPSPLQEWLLNRLVINLHKAKYLLERYNNPENQQIDMNQHYLKTAAVIEKLQEYTFIYTALHFNENVGVPKSKDPYEEYLSSSGFIKNKAHQVFYLDSGMQAINTATILARKFSAEQAKVNEPSKMKDKENNPYFEYPGIKRELNIYQKKPDVNNYIVSADLSPVLTAPGKGPVKSDEHMKAIRNNVNEDDIAILDVTNAPLSSVDNLIKMKHQNNNWAENFILVESLTKHQQIGADKFIMGRMIVVGSDNFIAKANEVVKPIADQAHEPILQEFRRNLDKAIYEKEIDNITRNFDGLRLDSNDGVDSGSKQSDTKAIADSDNQFNQPEPENIGELGSEMQDLQIAGSSNQRNQQLPENFEQLRQEKESLNKNQTQGDGNCFFHAVYEARNGKYSSQDTQQNVRGEVVDYLLTNQSIFGTRYGNDEVAITEDINKFLESGKWVEDEQVSVVAEALNLEIVIWHSNGDWYHTSSPTHHDNATQRIHLIYTGDHYNSLTRINL